MKKDLKKAILGIEVIQFDGQKADLEELVNPKQLEKTISDWMPEVLSQEWIDKNKFEVNGWNEAVHVEELQNLLVPKQEELESKIKVLIEAYKQEDGAYSNPENGWISGFVEDLENLVEEKPMYYALIKGHDVSNSDDIYWNYDKYDNDVFVSRLYPSHDNFLTEMSKSEWNEHGINDTNADFVKVDEESN